jgi:hypothetical protein
MKDSTMKKVFATIAITGALSLGLALVGVAPANAVTVNWPYTSCLSTGKKIRTTSYAKYSVTHKVETGAGAYLWTFKNGAAYVTNSKSSWGISQAMPGSNASGAYLSSASIGCV